MRYALGVALALSLIGTARAADLTRESLAGIHFGDTVAVVKQHLGKPIRQTIPRMGQATGAMESTLTYPNLEVGVGDGKVLYVSAHAPSTYATSKNLHVGDSAGKATAAYGKLVQSDEAHGLILSVVVEKGRVVKIYLGEGPE